jgi:serine phosphatase RsbU (regulator of sigma subunit)
VNEAHVGLSVDLGELLKRLTIELENFEDIARNLLPQADDVPALAGFDVFGGTLAVNGVVGGDLIIYMDFKRRFDLDARIGRAEAHGLLDVVENLTRCRSRAGILVIDAVGHRLTDAFPAAMLQQAFLVGAAYELDLFGRITHRLFENLNTRFYESSPSHRFISMIYGEISEQATFGFLSAAQPPPAIFSNAHDRFMDVACVSFPPLGIMPSVDVIDATARDSSLGFKNQYETNEWEIMGAGDILLLHTDGLVEHHNGDEPYFPHRLEETLRGVKHLGARQMFAAISEDVQDFGEPVDDISFVVIKRT